MKKKSYLFIGMTMLILLNAFLCSSTAMFKYIIPEKISSGCDWSFRRLRNNTNPEGIDWPAVRNAYIGSAPSETLEQAGLTGLAKVLDIPQNISLTHRAALGYLSEVIYHIKQIYKQIFQDQDLASPYLSVIKTAASYLNIPAENKITDGVQFESLLDELYNGVLGRLIDFLKIDNPVELIEMASKELIELRTPIEGKLLAYLKDSKDRNIRKMTAVILGQRALIAKTEEGTVDGLIEALGIEKEKAPEERGLSVMAQIVKALGIIADPKALGVLAAFEYNLDTHTTPFISPEHESLFQSVIFALESISMGLHLRSITFDELKDFVRENGTAVIRIGGGEFVKLTWDNEVDYNILSVDGTRRVWMWSMKNVIPGGHWDGHVWDEYAALIGFK